jgi:RHS repeat-associated protein
MTTIQGHQYEVRFDASDCEGSSTQWAITAKDEVNGNWYPSTYFTTGAIEWSFTATSNTTRIKFQLSDGAYVSEQPTPTYICLDNILINDLDLAHYEADVISYSDYYPFGSLMPGRNSGSEAYRYGFGGQEMDNEVNSVTGGSYTAEFWQYDSRLGRRWNIDPIKVAYESPYAAFRNNPITFNDPNGDCPDCPDGTYTLKKGESYMSLEKRWGMKAGSLAGYNPNLDASSLIAGSLLCLGL